MTEDRIDPETLAAFLDGRLQPDRRAEVARRLAGDGDVLELLGDAIAIQAAAASGEADHTSAAVHLPVVGGVARPGHRWGGLALAAAAVVAAVLLVPKLGRGPQLPGLAGVAIGTGDGALEAEFGTGWYDPSWPGTRGGGPAANEVARGFRAGVRLVDLRLAVEAIDRPVVRLAAVEVAELLDPIMGGGPLATLVRRLGRDAAGGEPSDAMRDHWADADAAVRGLFPRVWLDLGAWAEQARLSAMAGDSSFFKAGGVWLAELDRLVGQLERLEGDVSESVLVALRRLRDAIGAAETAAIREGIDALFRSGG